VGFDREYIQNAARKISLSRNGAAVGMTPDWLSHLLMTSYAAEGSRWACGSRSSNATGAYLHV